MTAVELSPPIRKYFESRNAFDVPSALAQFEDDAAVKDEGQEYRGGDLIRIWIEETQPEVSRYVRRQSGRAGRRHTHRGNPRLGYVSGIAAADRSCIRHFEREDRRLGDRLMSGGEFQGKRALVTGGTKGVGEAIARRLAAGGARVATTAREAPLQDRRPELFVQADVTRAEGVRQIVERVTKGFGGVDILIDNVGGSNAPAGGFAALSDDEWVAHWTSTCSAAARLPTAP